MNDDQETGEREIRVVCEEADKKERLDVALVRHLPEFSRARIQKLIESGNVRVDGENVRGSSKLRMGTIIDVTVPPVQLSSVDPEAISLHVLFEDKDVIVVNKPAGMVVHPGAGNPTGTLVNALLHHCKNLSGIGGVERPGIVHRLDKETTGCLVVAKSDAAHQKLAEQFASRETTKIYLALAHGKPRWVTITADFPIARHRVHRQKMQAVDPARATGREARTDFKVLHTDGLISLMECRLFTGRTHQIRVHLQKLGFPIVGDKIYGGRPAPGCERVMLHAWQLSFTHPRIGKLVECKAPIPDDLKRAVAPFKPDAGIRTSVSGRKTTKR